MSSKKICFVYFTYLILFAFATPLLSPPSQGDAEEKERPLNSREVVLIINRDSNDIRFMDIK